MTDFAERIKRRKAQEQRVHKTLRTEDPSGYNNKLMEVFFRGLDDKQFDQWMQDLRDKKTCIPIYTPPFKVHLQLKDLIKAADDLGVKLFERIKMWDKVGKRFFMTPNTYCVLRLPVRRLKQYLMDKISVPDNDRVINPITGQVTKPDKGSALSLPELQTMNSKDLRASMTELANVRGGNIPAYASFKAALEERGEADLNEIDLDTPVRSVVSTQVLIQSMMIDSNLVDTGE